MKRQYHRHLMRWAIVIPLIYCLVQIGLIFILQIKWLNEEAVLNIIAVLFTLVLTGLVMNVFIRMAGARLNRKFLRSFTVIEATHQYAETKQLVFNPNKKIPHAVLLLHGYAASPHEFFYLAKKLEEAKIAYYAPRNIGFGLTKPNLLFEICAEDWFRISLQNFDLLAGVAEEVSIVGQSMGAVLATFIAERRPVKELILCSPSFYEAESDLKYKRILKTPIISQLFRSFMPMLPKPVRPGRVTPRDILDSSVLSSSFSYAALPIRSVLEIFRVHELADITKARYQELTVIYGKQDLTVNNAAFINFLNKMHIKHSEHVFENSAHDIFEDYQKDEICDLIVKILKDSEQSVAEIKDGQNKPHLGDEMNIRLVP